MVTGSSASSDRVVLRRSLSAASKPLAQLIDEITVDAYDTDEQLSAFLQVFQDEVAYDLLLEVAEGLEARRCHRAGGCCPGLPPTGRESGSRRGGTTPPRSGGPGSRQTTPAGTAPCRPAPGPDPLD